MNEQESADEFSRKLDRIRTPDAGASREEKHALDVARRLRSVDFSRGSRIRYSLRAQLLTQQRVTRRPSIRASLRPRLVFAVAGLTLMLVYPFRNRLLPNRESNPDSLAHDLLGLPIMPGRFAVHPMGTPSLAHSIFEPISSGSVTAFVGKDTDRHGDRKKFVMNSDSIAGRSEPPPVSIGDLSGYPRIGS